MTNLEDGAGRVTLKAGEKCFLCTCGNSGKLPFCDGTHNRVNEKEGTCYGSLALQPDADVTLTVSHKNWKK